MRHTFIFKRNDDLVCRHMYTMNVECRRICQIICNCNDSDLTNHQKYAYQYGWSVGWIPPMLFISVIVFCFVWIHTQHNTWHASCDVERIYYKFNGSKKWWPVCMCVCERWASANYNYNMSAKNLFWSAANLSEYKSVWIFGSTN